MDMALSVVWMSMSVFLMSHVTLLIVLEPLRHNRADLNKTKDISALIHEMVFAQLSPFLVDISSASRLWYLLQFFPIPQVVVKTSGANFNNSVPTQTLLLVFVQFVALSRFKILIRVCIWVTYPYVKKGRSLSFPKSTCIIIENDLNNVTLIIEMTLTILRLK